MHGKRGDNLSNGSKIIENDLLVDAHYVIRFNRVMVQDKLWVLMPKVERKNRINYGEISPEKEIKSHRN